MYLYLDYNSTVHRKYFIGNGYLQEQSTVCLPTYSTDLSDLSSSVTIAQRPLVRKIQLSSTWLVTKLLEEPDHPIMRCGLKGLQLTLGFSGRVRTCAGARVRMSPADICIAIPHRVLFDSLPTTAACGGCTISISSIPSRAGCHAASKYPSGTACAVVGSSNYLHDVP